MLDDVKMAWAAGFFDGEGYVGLPKASREFRQLRASVAQVDRRPLDAFVEATGIGKVRGPYKRKSPKHRSIYMWMCVGVAVIVLFELLRPYLKLKHAQFAETMQKYEAYKRPNPHGRGVRKLTHDGVREARELCSRGVPQYRIADLLDVHQCTISRAVRGVMYATAGG